MDERIIQKFEIITDPDPAVFQQLLNDATTRLAKNHPKVIFNMNMGHCAYITYTEIEKIPETIGDEFSLLGLDLRCRNCPRFEWPVTKDGTIHRRKKQGTCKIAEYGFTNRDSPACEFFYRGLASGKTQIVDDDELDPWLID